MSWEAMVVALVSDLLVAAPKIIRALRAGEDPRLSEVLPRKHWRVVSEMKSSYFPENVGLSDVDDSGDGAT